MTPTPVSLTKRRRLAVLIYVRMVPLLGWYCAASSQLTIISVLTSSLPADFHYYGMLQHQQNMLQDYVRTATYYTAIMENQSDFAGKVVMDVGAGTGILSLFAAQVTQQPGKMGPDKKIECLLCFGRPD